MGFSGMQRAWRKKIAERGTNIIVNKPTMCTDIDRIDKYPMWQSRQRLELLICLSSDATFQLTPAEQNSP